MAIDALSERRSGLVTAAIDSGALNSEGVWLQAKPLLGLLVPVMNAAVCSVNAEVSIDGGTNYYDLLTAAGTQGLEFASVVGEAFFLSSEDLAPLAGYVGRYADNSVWAHVLVRLVASATQTADREFTWLMVA